MGHGLLVCDTEVALDHEAAYHEALAFIEDTVRYA